MYRYYSTYRNPVSAWILDGTAPFQECSGVDIPATMASGTAGKSVPLVSGAAYSSVFKAGTVAKFPTNVFQKGQEDRPFVMEAWVLPVPKTSGYVERPEVTNYLTNPSVEGGAVGWSSNNSLNWEHFVDNTRAFIGEKSRKYVSIRQQNLSSSAYGIGHNYGVAIPGAPTPGKYYTYGVYMYTDVPGRRGRLTFNYRDGTGAIISGTVSTGPYTPLSAGKWTKVQMVTPVAPPEASFVSCGAETSAISGGFPEIGEETWMDAAFLVEGDYNGDYFDGDLPDYEWTATPHFSSSKTTSNIARVNYCVNPEPITTSGWAAAGMTLEDAPWDSSKKCVSAVGNGSSTPYIFSAPSVRKFYKGQTVTVSATVDIPAGCKYRFALHKRIPNIYYDNQQYSAISTQREVKRLSQTFTLTEDVEAGNLECAIVYMGDDTVASMLGVKFYMGEVMIELADTAAPYFSGNDAGSRWLGSPHGSASALLPSDNHQQILSHNNRFDGLSINGNVVRFGTEYQNTGGAYCDYDLGEKKLAHVVGIHNSDQNQLWVNGQLVSSVDINDAQKSDSYVDSDGFLYCGHTTSSQEIAVNGVAFYHTLSGEDIVRNYVAGIDFIGQDRVVPQHGGTTFDLSTDSGAIFIEESWENKADFERGLSTDVTLAEDQIEPSYDDGISVEGSWATAVPLDTKGDTSIYGVMVAWTGVGVRVETSLDGIDWVQAVSGKLVSTISNGYNPTGKDLQIRAAFAGGLSDDPAYLEGLRVIGFRTNKIDNISARDISVSHPAVLRRDYEPNLYRDDNGISLNGGTLTIGADTTEDPDVARTLEFWIKPLYGVTSINVSGTRYRNGVPGTTLPVGEWSLVHIVSATDIAGSITVSGDAIVGQASLYPTALTATQVSNIFKSYTGSNVVRFDDNNTIVVTESPAPTFIYAHDWAIDSAG